MKKRKKKKKKWSPGTHTATQIDQSKLFPHGLVTGSVRDNCLTITHHVKDCVVASAQETSTTRSSDKFKKEKNILSATSANLMRIKLTY
jgi:hypothetical protein